MKDDLKALAGSVLCVGFSGDSPENAPLEALRQLQPGGVVLFARNISTVERTRALVDAVCAHISADGLRPIVAVDQEGGRVARLRLQPSPDDVPRHAPSAMAVAATRDLEIAERLGFELARSLRSVGANVDFAPVADLALVPASTVVGTRAYSDDPQLAARFVAASVRGLQRGGVAATVKHFPGHGATAVDSHSALPVIDVDLEALRARELVPFEAGFGAGAMAVMAGHLVVPALDRERPASLSPPALTGLLRDELGYQGVCFTDCLEMDAIATGVGTVRAAVLALIAGADAMTISHHVERALEVRDAIIDAVRRGELPEHRLREASSRMRRLREYIGAAPELTVETRDDPGIAKDAVLRAITLVRGTPSLGFQSPAVNLVSFEGRAADGVAVRDGDSGVLNLALRNRRIRSELLRVALAPTDAELESLFALIAQQSDRRLVVVMRRGHFFPAQARAIEQLLAISPDAILVSALEPFDAACFPQARTIVCTYGDDETTFEELANVLARGLPPSGTLPVKLSGIA